MFELSETYNSPFSAWLSPISSKQDVSNECADQDATESWNQKRTLVFEDMSLNDISLLRPFTFDLFTAKVLSNLTS